MNFKLPKTLGLLCAAALLLSSCGSTGPVKATKDIKFGEKFYNNWDGSKVGDKDTLILLSSFAGKDIPAGHVVDDSDLIDAVNVDIEWLKNTSFTAYKNSDQKLKLLPGAKLRLEKGGKTVAEGTWTISSKDADTNYLSVQFPGKKNIELLGAHHPEKDQRFLILSRGAGEPEEIWVEDIEFLKKSSSGTSHRKHLTRHKH